MASPKARTNKKFVASKDYRDNYDAIFSKPTEVKKKKPRPEK